MDSETQLVKGDRKGRIAQVRSARRARKGSSAPRSLARELEGEAGRTGDPAKVRTLADAVRGLTGN